MKEPGLPVDRKKTKVPAPAFALCSNPTRSIFRSALKSSKLRVEGAIRTISCGLISSCRGTAERSGRYHHEVARESIASVSIEHRKLARSRVNTKQVGVAVAVQVPAGNAEWAQCGVRRCVSEAERQTPSEKLAIRRCQNRSFVREQVQIDEGRIQAHLDEVVRPTVEETLNALLDAEVDHLCAPGSTSARRAARIHVPAVMIGGCRPRPAR